MSVEGDRIISQLIDEQRARAEQAEARAENAEQERDAAVALIETLRPSHYYCEDCWYSCPKAEDGCCDDARGPECDCGADVTNARINSFLAGLKGER